MIKIAHPKPLAQGELKSKTEVTKMVSLIKSVSRFFKLFCAAASECWKFSSKRSLDLYTT